MEFSNSATSIRWDIQQNYVGDKAQKESTVAKLAFLFLREHKKRRERQGRDPNDSDDDLHETRRRNLSWKEKLTDWIWDGVRNRITRRGRRDARDDDSSDSEDDLDNETPRKPSWKEKISDWVSSAIGNITRSYSRRSRNGEDAGEGSGDEANSRDEADDSKEEESEDIEKGLKDNNKRLTYDHNSWKSRVLTCLGLKRALTQSRVVRLPYRTWCKYLMIVLLILIGIFFTPQLMPNWAGYKLSTAENLCVGRDDKLRGIEALVKNLTKLEAGRNFVEDMRSMHICFQRSAAEFYMRPTRFQWPRECTEERAGRKFTREVCNPRKTYIKRKCIGGATGFFGKLFGGKTCAGVRVERKCVNVTEGGSQDALLKLYREQAASDKQRGNETIHKFGNVASDKAEKLMKNLIWKVDIASNLFIAYTTLALIIAVPFRVHKSEKKTRFIGAFFSLSKFKWIIIVLALWTAVEGMQKAFQEANWKLYLANLGKDPCYVDAKFNAQRMKIIGDACENVTETYVTADQKLQDLDKVYFLTRLFGMCKQNSTDNPKHPAENLMLEIRQKYQNRTFKNPAVCNVTLLDEKTSVAPNSKYSSFRIVMSTGVVPQLLLKFILTNLIVNIITFFEPMAAYSGQVEVWDKKELDPDEEESVKKFARDKRIIPLVITIIAAIFTFISLIWGLADTKVKNNQGNELTALVNSTATPNATRQPPDCPEGMLQSLPSNFSDSKN